MKLLYNAYLDPAGYQQMTYDGVGYLIPTRDKHAMFFTQTRDADYWFHHWSSVNIMDLFLDVDPKRIKKLTTQQVLDLVWVDML